AIFVSSTIGIAVDIGIHQGFIGVIVHCHIAQVHSGSSIVNLGVGAREGPSDLIGRNVLQISTCYNTVTIHQSIVNKDSSIIFDLIGGVVPMSHVFKETTSSVGVIHAKQTAVEPPILIQ